MYPRIPAFVLARIRRHLEATLTETCVIEEPTTTVGEYGEYVPSFAVVATVACRIIRAGVSNTNQQVESGEQEFLRETWRIVVPVGTPLDVGYRLTVADRIYRVIGLQDNLTDAVDTQAVVERWRGDAEQ